MWVFDRETLRFLDVNDAAIHYYGYSREEFLSKTIKDIRPPEDVSALLDHVEHIGQVIEPIGVWKHIRKDGSVIDAEVIAHGIDYEGRPARLILAVDVTERERAMTAAKESQARMLEVFGSCPVAVLVHRWKDKSFVDVNAQFTKLTGWARDEVIGKTMQDLELVPVETALGLRAEIEATGSLVDREVSLRNRSGEERTVIMGTVAVEMLGETHLVTTLVDITNRRRAAQALTNESNLLRTVFDLLPDYIYVKDTESRFIDCNEATAKLMGAAEPSEMTGKTDADYYPSDLADLYRKNEQEVLAGTPQVGKEEPYTPPTGDPQIIITTKLPLRDESGRITGLVGYGRNITESRRSGEHLRERDEQFRIYAEHSPVGIAMLDREMRYLVVSARWMEDFGLGDESLLGRSHYDVFPDLPDEWKAIHKKCLAGAIESSDEDSFVRADGSVEWLRWKVRPWHRSSGEIGGIVIFSEVITDRKTAEEAVRQSEERYRTLFEHSPDGILIADMESNYLDANPAACRMLGYTREELIGAHASDIVAPNELPRIGEAIGSLSQDAAYQREWLFVRKDGTTFAGEVDATQMPDGALMAAIRDVTERKRAEQLIAESETKLSGIIESAMDAIISINEEQRIVLFNAAAETMFGCSSHEAIGLSIEKFIPDRYRRGHSDRVTTFGNSDVVQRSMTRLVGVSGLRSNGEEFPIEASISHLETNGQKFFTVIVRDITQRRLSEAAAAHLAAIVDSSDDAIVGKDTNGIVTSWNKGAEKIFGFTPEEMVGRSITAVIPEDRIGEETEILERIRRGENVRHFDTVRIRKDGKPIDVSITVSSIKDNSGSIIGASKIARDVTDRKRSGKRLEAKRIGVPRVERAS